MTAWAVSPYARALGEVLRDRRRARGWTRKQLRAQLRRQRAHLADTTDISLQTVATYELGTRHMSVDRLDEIARALGTRAHLILPEVDRRIDPVGCDDKLVVDLATLATSTRRDILPAARWATSQIAALGPTRVELTPDALEALANLCGIELLDLFGVLRDFQPQRMTGPA
jgi:transcriptional regulator with XRE-family HTH domain